MPKEIIRRVKKIEIKTRHLVDGLLTGAYHSVFKGRGIEFSEVREYQWGEDIRAIDWNVTARMNKAYVKEYIEERDLTIYLLLDVSGSWEFGSERSKKEAAIEVAASLAFAALRNNDNIGLVMCTDKVEKYVPPKKGKKHALRIIREMAYCKPENRETSLEKPLRFIARIAKRRSVIFVISDLITGDFSKALKTLKTKHEIIAIGVNDKREKEIPDVGYIYLEDEETGEQMLVDTSDKGFREMYKRTQKEKREKLKKKLKKMKVDLIEIDSAETFEKPIRAYFAQKQKRQR